MALSQFLQETEKSNNPTNPVNPVEKNQRALFESDRTKWHKIYDAVYRFASALSPNFFILKPLYLFPADIAHTHSY